MPSILSDKSRFVFLHIPKNAGTTVGTQLSKAFPNSRLLLKADRTKDVGEYFADHPTLWQIQELAPTILRKIMDYDTLAVVREPRERFKSAIAEHVRSEYRLEPHKLHDKQLYEILNAVIKEASSSRNWRKSLNFFRPQIDYIELGGTRYANQLFDAARLQDLEEYLLMNYRVEIDLCQRARQTRSYSKGVASIINTVAPLVRRAVPNQLYHAIKQRLQPALSRADTSSLDKLLAPPNAADFLNSFYEDDFRLYREVRNSRVSTPT